MTDQQAVTISRAARYLLTDLEQLLGVDVSRDQAIEQRALQLITDAFEQAAPLYLGARFKASREAIDLVFNPTTGQTCCHQGSLEPPIRHFTD